jgi:peptidoglycan/LPS O-acetylase OafA/YrhL
LCINPSTLDQHPKHIKQLDGLRGIAIILVLLVHFYNFGTLAPYLYFGWAGVDLFFVLSGFLITGILLHTKHKKGYYRIFIARRALRILPLYYAVLIVIAILALFINSLAWFRDYQYFYWLHAANYLILQKGFFLPLGHFWSLAIEEQFYLVWPLIVLLCNRRWLIIISTLLILLGIYLRATIDNIYLVYGLPLAHLDGLLIGAIMAVLIREYRDTLFKYIEMIFVCTAALFFMYTAGWLIMNRGNSEDAFIKQPFTFTLVSLFFGALMIYSLKSKRLGAFLSGSVLRFFGKYSYAMYLFHPMLYHFSNWAGGDRLAGIEKLLLNTGLVLLTIAMSYASYHLFEKHFLRIKDRITYA